MTKGEAIRYMNSHPEVILARDNSGKGFICPFCGSGTGDKGTGITAKTGRDGYPKLRCWACDEVGEVGADGTIHAISTIDLAAKMRGVNPANTKEAIVAACDLFGIAYNELDNDAGYTKRNGTSGAMQPTTKSSSTRPAQAKAQPTPPASAATSGTAKKDEKPQVPIYTDAQFAAMREAALNDTYLAQRGISAGTIARHGIGIDASYRPPDKKGETWKAVVFAFDKYSAEYRNTDASAAKGDRYRKKGKAKLWNLDAIRDGEPVFVTEGVIDALSIDEVGGACVGLGSASNVDMFLAELRARSNDAKRGPLPSAVIDVLDNDDTGRADALKLRDGVKGIGGILYFDGREVMGASKDPNDALLAERDAFAQRVEAMKDKPLDEYMEANAASRRAIEEFWTYVSKNRVFSTTGFSDLDDILGGGIFAGALYFIGAISSLGKTTFCLELADNVAKSGVDVLYFSLEMSKFELMAKSMSRLTHRNPASTSGKKNLSKTTRGIMTGSFHEHYTKEETDIIYDALDTYANEIGEHMFIFDGLGSIGTDEIAKAVRTHKRMTKRTPLVVIDYVQILKAQDERATDQRNIDMNVVALKKLAVAEELPIIGISSFNRENYTAPVNMTAFKQSGGIEYSSDVLIGLQYYGMDEPKRNADGEESAAVESEQAGKARRQKVINKWNKVKEKGVEAVVPIELKVLKNRNGKLGTQLFYFWPAVNDIKEVSVMFGENEVERDDELTPDRPQAAPSVLDSLTGKVKIGRARTDAAQEKRRFDVFATPTLTSLEVASMRKSYREFCERHPHGEELVAEWAKRQKITDLAKMTGGQYKDLLAYFERIDAIAIMYGKTDDDAGDPNAAKMQTLLESSREAPNQKALDDIFAGAAGTTDKEEPSSYTSPTPPAPDDMDEFF